LYSPDNRHIRDLTCFVTICYNHKYKHICNKTTVIVGHLKKIQIQIQIQIEKNTFFKHILAHHQQTAHPDLDCWIQTWNQRPEYPHQHFLTRLVKSSYPTLSYKVQSTLTNIFLQG
jgi:hypothetical protein